MICLDTHSLLWWTLDPDRLSEKASRACAEMERTGGCVSAISIWELGLKIRQGKLEIGMELEVFYQMLKRCTYLEIIPVDAEIWMRNLRLNWEHRDPADRTIVATALRKSVPLLTADTAIHGCKLVDVIW